MMSRARTISVIDSHTGGEPTRVVIAGGPDLPGQTISERLESFRKGHDRFRSAIVNEPRGSDAMVGGLLCEPFDKSCAAGIIFFNNVGYLGMCGHGTIGLVATLAHMGRIKAGEHRIETPVGIVTVRLNEDGSVSLDNVPSYRKTHNATIKSGDRIVAEGDVAWGGNWFFLAKASNLSVGIESLTQISWDLRQAVNAGGFPEVDHIELFGEPLDPKANSRSFVLCPGKAYDRSPCGTGTSAKLACLAADGVLQEGETWIQESIIGSQFKGKYRWLDRDKGIIVPTITGAAFVNSEATFLLDERDPFCWGIR
jgi:4-hydroxyproline epimerase